MSVEPRDVLELSGLVVSCGTLITGLMMARQKSSMTTLGEMAEKLRTSETERTRLEASCVARVQECARLEIECLRLRDENLFLMRKVVRVAGPEALADED